MLVAIEDADVPQLVALMNRAYRGTGDSAGWNSEAGVIAGNRTNAEFFRAELAEKPDGHFLKWVDGPDISGCVWLEPLGDGIWYLGSLATDPERQNNGLGRAVLTAAERWVQARGGKRIRMTVVNVRDTLIAWYERRGYTQTGGIAPFPYDDQRFGTPLRDDLHFVVLEKAV
ncbi:GNAT family N-acetyltransferase [Sandarakinorhabdus cyanobacteriorum]|uniref:GNAT family N-acetyltransferase n=1 Tax=Sandarakinorhabdus cyanobacteriorum TaxID=1981098 RepID=A0A255YC65_9SPHN|nr:GNAT family N-acetyltransferase [Sandarakinorhabdus cyanobacteriorum]OYQ26050.1 GNAT family N-acetyltransferase [Sandarakinorhabdus cyanobacteriorum]